MSTPTPTAPTLIIVSGLSGSGKSVALKTFEDQDYYCSDNLPIQLLPAFVRSVLENHDGGAPRRLAVGIDVRGQADLSQLGNWRKLATDAGVETKVLYFEASDETMLKRYADTRRRHPLSQLGLSLPEAIARERELIAPLRREADVVIDTSALNVHQLRRRIITEFAMGHATRLSPADPWERLLISGVARDMQQVRLDFLAQAKGKSVGAHVDTWLAAQEPRVRQFRQLVERARTAPATNVAMLAEIAGQARGLLNR